MAVGGTSSPLACGTRAQFRCRVTGHVKEHDLVVVRRLPAPCRGEVLHDGEPSTGSAVLAGQSHNRRPRGKVCDSDPKMLASPGCGDPALPTGVDECIGHDLRGAQPHVPKHSLIEGNPPCESHCSNALPRPVHRFPSARDMENIRLGEDPVGGHLKPHPAPRLSGLASTGDRPCWKAPSL